MKKVIYLIMCICAIFMFSTIIYAEQLNAETAEITETDENTEIAEESGKIDRIINSITNSAFWTVCGGFLLALVSALALIKKHFGTLAVLVRSKASAEELENALKTAQSEISDNFKKEYSAITKQLKAEQDNTKKLTIMLSIFMSNAKINSNAKAEIMQIMSGIKDISGNAIEVIEEINKNIEKSNESEEKPKTPLLDEIVQEITQPSLSLE